MVASVALDDRVLWRFAGIPTVMVLDRLPEYPASMVAETAIVMTPPSGTVTELLMDPEPLESAQLAPPLPLQVQLTPFSAAGMVSTTEALTTVMSAGPLLVMVIV